VVCLWLNKIKRKCTPDSLQSTNLQDPPQQGGNLRKKNVAFDAVCVWPCCLLGLVPFGCLADASLRIRSFSSIKTYSRVSFLLHKQQYNQYLTSLRWPSQICTCQSIDENKSLVGDLCDAGGGTPNTYVEDWELVWNPYSAMSCSCLDILSWLTLASLVVLYI